MDAFKLLTNTLIECNNGAFVIDLISEPSKEQMQKLIEGSGNPESEMRQVNSSAGLAVNFWRAYELSHPESRVEFEWKKQVPLKRGIPANIDVVVRDSDKISFIESKFLEPYYSGNETPRSSYLEASKYSKATEPAQRWVELFTQAESFQGYNVVQLCRHLLAIYKDIRKCPKDYEKRKVQLCSVTWKMPEPFLSLFTEEYQNAFIEKTRPLAKRVTRLHASTGYSATSGNNFLYFHHLKKNKKTAKVVRFQVDYYLTKIKPHIPSGHTVRTEKQT